MKTVKLSYSILNAWAMGQQEQAIGMYMGQQLPPTPQMELGSAYDKVWEQHINANKSLPDELGGGVLVNPTPQTKYEKIIPVNDELQILLRGVPDCPDEATIYEFKCGMTTATQYVDSMQADYYKLLYPQANIAIYLCYNPYFKTLSKGIKFLNRHNAESALNHIYTHGLEFIDYLQGQKLLKDYKG